MRQRSFIALAFSSEIMQSAVKVALLVGTMLALINHGDKIMAISLTNQDFLKILLSYMVPYGVSTWSAIRAIRAHDGKSK